VRRQLGLLDSSRLEVEPEGLPAPCRHGFGDINPDQIASSGLLAEEAEEMPAGAPDVQGGQGGIQRFQRSAGQPEDPPQAPDLLPNDSLDVELGEIAQLLELVPVVAPPLQQRVPLAIEVSESAAEALGHRAVRQAKEESRAGPRLAPQAHAGGR